MKASSTPAQAKRPAAIASRTSRPRRATERVVRLTNEFRSQLQQLEHSPPVKLVFAPSPGRTASGVAPRADGDIMAQAFIVLMESAKSAREDLKSIMDQVKAINKAKQDWRAELGLAQTEKVVESDASFQVAATLYVGHVAAEMQALRRELTSMSEMGEMESLRLQMAMDRLTKLMSTLASLLKRIADSANQITQHLK